MKVRDLLEELSSHQPDGTEPDFDIIVESPRTLMPPGVARRVRDIQIDYSLGIVVIRVEEP